MINISISGSNMNSSSIPYINDSYLYKCASQPQNPWCGKFGVQQVVEVIYLLLISVLGTFGNLILIWSIVLEKKTYRYGNIFIINLAFTDFLITGLYTPTVIANVYEGGNALPLWLCHLFGYVIIATCTVSMWNLAIIAINRYWSIVKSTSYSRIFSKRNIHILLVGIWVYSFLIPIPTLVGWTDLIYDYKAMVCAWDDVRSISFTIYVLFGAILFPLAITTFCYWTLFRFVRKHFRRMRTISRSSSCAEISYTKKEKQSMKREISLLKTLATTVVCFVLCWTPYAFCILIDRGSVDPVIKKTCTWLGLNNSAINFVIYGLMNKEFRKGYKNLLLYIFCCRPTQKSAYGGSNSNQGTAHSIEHRTITTYNDR